jgi:hypothetical protein
MGLNPVAERKWATKYVVGSTAILAEKPKSRSRFFKGRWYGKIHCVGGMVFVVMRISCDTGWPGQPERNTGESNSKPKSEKSAAPARREKEGNQAAQAQEFGAELGGLPSQQTKDVSHSVAADKNFEREHTPTIVKEPNGCAHSGSGSVQRAGAV